MMDTLISAIVGTIKVLADNLAVAGLLLVCWFSGKR